MENKVKVVAFHLPQFHCIPENDEWWGKGFTEWTNVKQGVKQYKGHYQPRIPYNHEYYDLLNIKDLSKQMRLARQYNVDAFCYYHYWFNGKLLLEKPLHLMRTMEDRLPYFFCWANEPWIRSWKNSREVLQEQKYGDVSDWTAHFTYFMEFFKDQKYIKINNKPVLVIYRANNIEKYEEMINFWNRKCRESGFSGLYIIEEKNGFQNEVVSSLTTGYLEFEPLYTLKTCRSFYQKVFDYTNKNIFNRIHKTNHLIYKYDSIWNTILSRRHAKEDGKSINLGAFIDWDNTARKGINSTLFIGATPEKFEKYMTHQLKRAKQLNSPFIFINAWNEWGEGTYLEPDEQYKFRYIEALKRAIDQSGIR